MTTVLSLGLAALFVLLFSDALRKRPVPFYWAAGATAAAVTVLTWTNAAPSGALWSVLAHGGLAGALFIVVMVTGALPNGSKPMRFLMPLRAPLSILASILTLGHNAAYGKTYFVRLFTAPASLSATQAAAAVCSLLMLAIMLPLFVTSFPRVRRRMDGVRWKKLQRLAYGFYALLFCHLLLLMLPAALRGGRGYVLSVFLYSLLFCGYALCRVLKAVALRRRNDGGLARRQGAALLGCAAVLALLLVPLLRPVGVAETGGSYRDGVYTGKAFGNGSEITVSVSVEGGVIADVHVLSHGEDEPYITDAMAVLEAIVENNSPAVDVVSGATFSSGGIIDAVADALRGAA